MPKSSQRRSSGQVSDISTATVAKLTHLLAEVLRLHLSLRHLVTTGQKTTMARRCYKALHATNPINPASSPATNVRIIPPPTSSPPPTNTSMTASSDVTELPPAIQAHFSLVQQLIPNAVAAPAQGSAQAPAQVSTQANLSPASECSNNAAPANTQPSNFNTATPTFTQLLNSTAGTTSQPFITLPYQVVNQQASNRSTKPVIEAPSLLPQISYQRQCKPLPPRLTTSKDGHASVSALWTYTNW